MKRSGSLISGLAVQLIQPENDSLSYLQEGDKVGFFKSLFSSSVLTFPSRENHV